MLETEAATFSARCLATVKRGGYGRLMALKDILAARRGQINAEIKALKAELADIATAEAAIATTKIDAAPVPKAGRPLAGVRPGSIKDWILKALDDYPQGLDTEGVITAVELIGGPPVVRNSMTPQLSRLKGIGLITQEGRLWKRINPISSAASLLDAVMDSMDSGSTDEASAATEVNTSDW